MSRERASYPSLIGLIAFAMLTCPQTSARAAEDDFVTTALSRAIIGPRQTMIEAADYIDNLVPRMPEVKTLAEWETYAARARANVLDRVIFRGEAATWRDENIKIEDAGTIEDGKGYRIQKLRYEVIPDLWIPALLYLPTNLEEKGKATTAAVLNVNGHDPLGKAAEYKQIRCINQAKRGIISLNIEWFGMGQLKTDGFRHDLINHIDLTGTSGVALHYLAMTRAIDLLLGIEQTDPARIAVTGLSGGGWQTIFVSAFDTRVKLTNPVAGYSSDRTRVRVLPDLGDSEQTPSDLATITDYAIMTAMMAPRPTLLTFNAKDQCCFAAPTALPPLIEAAGPIFKLYGKEANLRSHINHDPGTHNYLLDNRQANYQMLADHFFPGDAKFDPKEIPSESEVKTPKELEVELPTPNADFQAIALGLAKKLPTAGALPTAKQAAEQWTALKRTKLAEVIHAKNHDVQVVTSEEESKSGIKATYWRLNVGGWSVPVVELVKGEPKGTTLLLADGGRKEAVTIVQALIDKGERVLAVDPFYVGESRLFDKDYLWALMLATVGDRPLGLQAGEISAVARWAAGPRKLGPLTLHLDGKRATVIGLVAAALENKSIAAVGVSHPLGSLKELIEKREPYAASPELFGFGLLHDFDVLQLAALVAPRPLRIADASPRAISELFPLRRWTDGWKVTIEPIR